MNWRVLDLSNFEGDLKYKRGQIRVIPGDTEEVSIPLKEAGLLLCGHHVRVTSGLMLKLAESGIPLLITDWKSVPVGAFQSWSQHTRVGARQIAQANLSLPRKKAAWASLVRAKILGQAKVQFELGHADTSRRLEGLAKSVRSGDPANVEGHAARLHWQHFSRNIPFTRDHSSSDPLNITLNYGYTILRGFCIRATLSAGLWPALGVFHHGRSNAFNLVDDFIEPFRPVVDHIVASLPPGAEISDPAVKSALARCVEGVFTSDGSTVSTQMNHLAQSFGKYVEGDIPKLIVPYWEPS